EERDAHAALEHDKPSIARPVCGHTWLGFRLAARRRRLNPAATSRPALPPMGAPKTTPTRQYPASIFSRNTLSAAGSSDAISGANSKAPTSTPTPTPLRTPIETPLSQPGNSRPPTQTAITATNTAPLIGPAIGSLTPHSGGPP